jgi:hypothetical protein
MKPHSRHARGRRSRTPWVRLCRGVATPRPPQVVRSLDMTQLEGPGWFESTRELLLGLQIQEIWQDDEEGGEMPAMA